MKTQYFPVGVTIILDLFIRVYAENMSSLLGLGAEAAITKKESEKSGNSEYVLVPDIDTNNTITPIGRHFSPKVADVDRDKGWSRLFTKERRNNIILDDCTWS